jgi:hypothetical protein
MTTLDSPTFVLAFLLASYSALIVHEAGHALVGRAVGFEVTSFGAGTARPWFVMAPWGVRFYLAVVRPLNGLTFVFMPQLNPSRTHLALFAAGGILANTLVAVLGFVLWSCLPWGSNIWGLIAVLNGLMGSPNLIPFPFRIGKTVLRSDGALIIQALRSGSIAPTPPMIIQILGTFRGLWLAIGDTRILRVYLMSAAEQWALLGDIAHAKSLCREADSLPGNVPPAIRHLTYLARGTIATAAGRLADAHEALDAAESGYRAAHDEFAMLLVNANRAIARIVGGDPSGGDADLETLMAHPLMSRQGEIGIGILTGRLVAMAASSDTSALERLHARYERERRKRPSATRDLRVYAALAGFHARRDDWAGAESHHRRAMAALGALTASWGDPADRARFLAAQSALLDEFRRCFQALGKPAEADALIDSLTITPASRISPERDLRFRRWGTRLILANVVLTASTVGILLHLRGKLPIHLAVAVIVSWFATIPGALYLVIDATVGRLVPTLRQGRGLLILLLSCLPWITAIVVLLT